MNRSKMKDVLFLLFILSLSFSKAEAASMEISINSVVFVQSSSLFEEANAAYAEGDYETAVAKYEEILEKGETAAEVHYNLANAHYKLNHVAPSIYHYEKALQLDPADNDIQNNLQFAQNMTVDAIEENPQSSFSKWWNSFLNTFSPTGWAYAGIACMVLFVILFLAYYFNAVPFRKRLFFITGFFFLFLSLGSVALGFTSRNKAEAENFAIVFAEEVEVRSEPNSRGNELFTLHEGTKVEILEDFEEWSKIELANGNQGWLRQESVKRL